MYSDNDYLKRIVFDLLTYGRVAFSETSDFKQKKHNRDLVPSFNERFNEVLDYFDRYRKISYDIQGVRDCGIDVLITYEVNDSKKLIGIQIKSYDDIKEQNWLSKLKAQLIDVQSTYHADELTDYYVIMCTDIQEHKDKIRNATADLLKIKGFEVHIVQPENSLYFLNMPNYAIGAYLKRKFSDQDCVVRKSKDSLSDLSLAQSAMIIEAAAVFVSQTKTDFDCDEIVDSRFVREIYDNYPNFPADYFEDPESYSITYDKESDPLEDLQIISDRGYFDLPTYTDMVNLNPNNYAALIALMYDAKVRYDYRDDELKWYVFYTLKQEEVDILKENGYD